MSWIEQLWRTYEAHETQVARPSGDHNEAVLLPICHMTQKAQIEVVIDGEGHFLRARVVPAGQARTIIPCTEDSESRSGNKPVHHPLCDKLQYVAGDFVAYGGKVTKGFETSPREPYESYVTDLARWCESPFGHRKLRAVLKYVQRGRLVEDLVAAGTLYLGPDGKLLEEWTDNTAEPPAIFQAVRPKPQWEAFVRWVVEIPGDPQAAVWSDLELYDSWIRYYLSQPRAVDVCYVTGRREKRAAKHPADIRRDGDDAKIISGNDDSGFTFRGRFTQLDEAISVGLETTQKAHKALRWLMRKQGTRIGDFAVVAWSVMGEDVPDPLADSFELLGIDAPAVEARAAGSVGEDFALRLRRRMLGYNASLGDASHIVVMAVDSLTPGRLSIAFYRELNGSEFLARIEHWHATCAWRHSYKLRPVEGTRRLEPVEFVGAPAPVDIAYACYGRTLDEKLQKRAVQRLLPCIIDGQPIPADFVERAVRRAASPLSHVDDQAWNKTLSIACALYRKQNEREGYDLALEEGRRSRDYLFGRLLALADELEAWALRETSEKRTTNAVQLMARFADRPYSTWRTLEAIKLTPYKLRLGTKGRGLLNQISYVTALFDPNDFTSDRPLSGEFLLGYHCQRQALRDRRLSGHGGQDDSGADEREEALESKEEGNDHDHTGQED